MNACDAGLLDASGDYPPRRNGFFSKTPSSGIRGGKPAILKGLLVRPFIIEGVPSVWDLPLSKARCPLLSFPVKPALSLAEESLDGRLPSTERMHQG